MILTLTFCLLMGRPDPGPVLCRDVAVELWGASARECAAFGPRVQAAVLAERRPGERMRRARCEAGRAA